jgi:hypothetical protein
LWKQYYLRSSLASDHFTKERFNYLMCPIRHFKECVKIVESTNNMVFAADSSGKFAIFLIHEKDLENDDEKMLVQTLEFPDGVEYIKHYPKD